jgi:hypothetical protein
MSGMGKPKHSNAGEVAFWLIFFLGVFMFIVAKLAMIGIGTAH